MRPFLFSLLFLFSACGVKTDSVQYGKTTVSDLILEKGQPLEEEAIAQSSEKVLHFPDNEKFQVRGDIVINGFKNPKGNQKTVLFWKHRFKDCSTVVSKLPTSKSNHGLSEYELSCPEEGMSVIYSEGSEFVSRIVEYEKK